MSGNPPPLRWWKDAHNWANVAVAFCALIVSIVSLWTTSQVSGVQDYLQSEIKRRNNELNGIAGRSRSLEALADQRAERLSSLQLATDTLIVSSFDTQRRILSAEAELAKVRSEEIGARLRLADAKESAKSLRSDLTRQGDAFDLFSRSKAIEYANIQLSFQSIYDDFKSQDGASTIKYLTTLRVPDEQKLLQPYLDRISNNIGRVCPALSTWKLSLPNKVSPPARPTISYRKGTSKSEIQRLTNAALDQWSKDFDRYGDASKARLDAQLEGTKRLHDLTRRCMCQTLSDEKFSAKQICPSA